MGVYCEYSENIDCYNEPVLYLYDVFDLILQVVAVTDYAEGELFQILEDDGNLPETQVTWLEKHWLHNYTVS